jgi:hypothetical protein
VLHPIVARELSDAIVKARELLAMSTTFCRERIILMMPILVGLGLILVGVATARWSTSDMPMYIGSAVIAGGYPAAALALACVHLTFASRFDNRQGAGSTITVPTMPSSSWCVQKYL